MNNDEFKQLSAAARRANLLDYFQNSGYTVEKKKAQSIISKNSPDCASIRTEIFGFIIIPGRAAAVPSIAWCKSWAEISNRLCLN